jgi:flavodoxin
MYGNTKEVAEAIGGSLPGEALLLMPGEAKIAAIQDIDLLIVGSPTHGGRPTPQIEEFLAKIPAKGLQGIRVAAFDTRFAPEDHGVGLRILMTVIRFAAERIAKTLVRKGGKLAVEPEGFIVNDKEGPLKKGELARAGKWASQIRE